jgi:hypothetical protein
MVYRLYESAGYLGPFPAFADSADFDTLRLWAVSHNEWKGPQMAAVIVADDDRVWYVSRSGKAREVSYERGRTGGPSQAEKLIARLEGRLTGPHPAYELAPPERQQHKTIHVGHTGPNDCCRSDFTARRSTGDPPSTRGQCGCD